MGRGKTEPWSTRPEPSQGAEVLHRTCGTFRAACLVEFQKCAVSRAGLGKGDGTSGKSSEKTSLRQAGVPSSKVCRGAGVKKEYFVIKRCLPIKFCCLSYISLCYKPTLCSFPFTAPFAGWPWGWAGVSSRRKRGRRPHAQRASSLCFSPQIPPCTPAPRP